MKQDLLLLHGAIGSKEQLIPLSGLLNENFKVHLLNFSGHGGRKIPEENFSIQLFAKDVITYAEENSISSLNIFGYSMGGYVGLYLAKHNSKLINKVFSFATKFEWNKSAAEKEANLLIPEKIELKVPGFAKQLKTRHAPSDWKEVLSKTAQMMLAMGENPPLSNDDFYAIKHTARIGSGDKDKMITKEETKETSLLFPHSTYVILEDTPHPIEQVSLDKLKNEICCFFG